MICMGFPSLMSLLPARLFLCAPASSSICTHRTRCVSCTRLLCFWTSELFFIEIMADRWMCFMEMSPPPLSNRFSLIFTVDS